ncbi:hypothetical protein Tco_1450414 [Tanacetum coccineum]
MLKAYAKDLKKISKIIQKENECLPNLKERWVSKSNVIPNVPKLMQISSFMSLHKCPELSKHFSDSIPKTVDEMLKRVDDYVRLEEAFHDKELRKGEFQQKETQGAPIKEKLNKYSDYHNEKGHSTNDYFQLKKHLEISLESGRLNHLVKDAEDQKRKSMMVDEEWMNVPITFLLVFTQDLTGEDPIVEAKVEGYLVRRIHMDEGASIEIIDVIVV